jgi:hypothetical protein
MPQMKRLVDGGRQALRSLPYSNTNKGIQILLPIRHVGKDKTRYIAQLDCAKAQNLTRVGIYVKRMAPGDDQFVRVDLDKIPDAAFQYDPGDVNTMYFRQKPLVPSWQPPYLYFTPRVFGFYIRIPTRKNYSIDFVLPEYRWNRDKKILQFDSDSSKPAGALRLKHGNDGSSVLVLWPVLAGYSDPRYHVYSRLSGNFTHEEVKKLLQKAQPFDKHISMAAIPVNTYKSLKSTQEGPSIKWGVDIIESQLLLYLKIDKI